MKNQAPFLDVSSFVMDELSQESTETFESPSTPFLSVYESEENGELINPETEDQVAFLNELYDEEFDEALFELVNEAVALHDTRFSQEMGDPAGNRYEAEHFLEQHFLPLQREAQEMIHALASELGRRDIRDLTEDQIGMIVDQYQPPMELSPSFENFWGKVKKAFKKVANKAAGLAKKGLGLAAKLGLGPVLNKLRTLVRPLLRRVIQTAIGKLPRQLQPIARKLSKRLPFLKELDESDGYDAEIGMASEVAQIQYEFNQQVATLLFAATEVEQDLEIAHLQAEEQSPDSYPVVDLDHARQRFLENVRGLKEGEDVTPHVENFIPAILPALKLGIKLIGRKRVVGFLARLLGKLIRKFVGPQYAPALSRSIVDAGLRLIQVEATVEDEAQAAASAVAATVEETVRRVAALPDHVLDNQELLEGFALEAFEQAAAVNLPQILPEETYLRRPELGEAKNLRGTWVMMPRGRKKRYKKYSRKISTRLAPFKVSALETFGGISLDGFLEEECGVPPGEEIEAFVHLYEGIPGTHLSDIARLEENTPGLGTPDKYQKLHPLTREAAGLLTGEPGLGREMDAQTGTNPHTSKDGQRFYYLELPGRGSLMIPRPASPGQGNRPTQVRLSLDFPRNEIHVHLFLSEMRAQEVIIKLRQNAHIGSVIAHIHQYIERGLRRALTGAFGQLKIVHEAVTPAHWSGTLRRLPSIVQQVFLSRLQEWVYKGLAEHLKQHTREFIDAAQNAADGVTLTITIANPPGFSQLRQALRGKGVSIAGLNFKDGEPAVKLTVSSAYRHD